MRSCKWSLRSHYEKQWGKRALMGRLQFSPRVPQLWNSGRTHQLNGSHPLSGIAAAGYFISAWCSALAWALAVWGPGLFSSWKLENQQTSDPQPSVLCGSIATVNENTSDIMLFVSVCSCKCLYVWTSFVWVGACARMCMHAWGRGRGEHSLVCRSLDAVYLGF